MASSRLNAAVRLNAARLAGSRPPARWFARNAHGRGWFKQFEEHGQESFSRHRRPPPFDWSLAGETELAYLDVSINGEDAGRIEIEVLSELLPNTAENFMRLCTGDNPQQLTYVDTPIHLVVRDAAIVGGDVELKTGKGSHSAFGCRYFPDEAFVMTHHDAGVVSMVNGGVDTNGSQFYITTAPSPHLDGYSVAFGRVSRGMDVVHKITGLFSIKGVPVAPVVIRSAGLVQ